ncbi:ankyrin repeat-containing domain protein [Chaetomidium leptoderma]|uniref:Ankyrin repeat-containing domain protein n=1 Tax=Chaetomidium leptoderma TaxID=669021 RepID=A0AAN6ZYX6_9PEZI|nr:ankyrin repeat-containing domain protein [Chaetomidium leptoderma]
MADVGTIVGIISLGLLGFAGAARATRRQLAYPFRQSTLQKLDEDIDEICTNLTLALQVLQQQDIGIVRDEVQITNALLELIQASQVSDDIRNWLRAPDASINYNEACKKKHTGTGLWFVGGSKFNTWLTTANSFLWLHGSAGCGKSVLSSTIIQHTLRRMSNPFTNIGIAFFYFTFNDKAKQDASSMLRALLLQLTSQLKGQDTVSQLYQTYRNGTPPDLALLDCLHQLVSKFDHVYIILDALDESPRGKHREYVLEALNDMRGWPGPGLHLLVTSRDEQDIREHLDPPAEQVVPMKNESIDADIASFVSGHLKTNHRLWKWEEHHDQIERAFTEGAKGVFRWVECQFAALEACPRSKTRLDACLRSLPQTLDKTYERMLSNIEEESADDARRALVLLCTAKRPLKVEELIDGLAVKLGDNPRFNEDSRLRNEDDIRHICPGFIELDLHPRRNGSYEVRVRIAHYSVQEYLESDRIRTSGATKFTVRPVEANTEVASICLAYLMDPKLCEERTDRSSSSDFDSEYPLAQYAAYNWPDHYHEGSSSNPRLHRLALQLFQDDQAFRGWLGVGFRSVREHESPLSAAAAFGLDPIVQGLLAWDSVSLSRPEGYYESAFIAAAECGHATTVQLLIEYVADIDYTDYAHDRTALQVASKNSHFEVVETLLDHGANIEAHDEHGQSPLSIAARYGRGQMVQLLLDRGANIEAHDRHGQTPLETAAFGGYDRVVALLLGRGADPNRGSHYRLPLEGARNATVAQLLIDGGADINLGKRKTPLEAACTRGMADVVALLLDQGADVEKAGGYGNLLERVVSAANEEMAELLLDRGANVNEGRHYTPLEAAASYDWRPDMLKLLLEMDPDVNCGREMTPLEAAAVGGCIENADLLLEAGADPDRGIKKTPLEAAVSGERPGEIMTLLLCWGADANLGIEMTPLEAVIDKGVEKMELARLLIVRGADINLGLEMTPLQFAKRRGLTELVQWLIEIGADDVEQESNRFRWPKREGGGEKDGEGGGESDGESGGESDGESDG